jgi:hypothetical protein
MPSAWSRQGSGRKVSGDTSSRDTPGGYKAKMDPTLPTSQQAVAGPDGKRVGVIKKRGGKFTSSADNHQKEHASPQAAVRHFAELKKQKTKS